MTFSQFLGRLGRTGTSAEAPFSGDEDGCVPTESLPYDPREQEDDRPQVAERSTFRNPFKGAFKAVNPARPVSPANSRLFSLPGRRKRLRSQVMGG